MARPLNLAHTLALASISDVSDTPILEKQIAGGSIVPFHGLLGVTPPKK